MDLTQKPASHFEIHSHDGSLSAVISKYGGTILSLTAHGFNFLDGDEPDDPVSSARGQLLFPWPNRIDGGRYNFMGIEYQLPINEVATGNAIHGFVRNMTFSADRILPDLLVLNSQIGPQPGYPFEFAIKVSYKIIDSGVKIAFEVANLGIEPMPIGLGLHPYLRIDGQGIDSWELKINAEDYLEVNSRSIPISWKSVDASRFDFREFRKISSTVLDTCLKKSIGANNQLATLKSPLRRVIVSASEHFNYVQLYSGDTVGDSFRRRKSLAIEPMSCPPNSFNTGESLVTLDPGRVWQSWVKIECFLE